MLRFTFAQIIRGLQVHPVLLARSEIFCKPLGSVGRYSSFLFENIGNSGLWHKRVFGQFVRRYFKIIQKFVEKHAGMEWIVNHVSHLVIICYFNLISVAVFKPKADAKLLIDANAVLTISITFNRFQSIGWWYSQIIHACSVIKLNQSHSRSCQKSRRESLWRFTFCDHFGLFVSECLNHAYILTKSVSNVKR